MAVSGFLSQKYLKYRGLPGTGGPRVTEDDRSCSSCGYNLRGLPFGRACPECGEVSERGFGQSPSDPLLPGELSLRKRISLGLLIGGCCLLAALTARMAFFIMSVFAIGNYALHYVLFGGVVSICWIVASFMMMAAARSDDRTRRKWILAATWSQLLWIPGYALLAARVALPNVQPETQTELYISSLLLRGLAGAGSIGIAFFMMRAAEDAELDDAPRRLNNAIWILPLLTIVLAILPREMGWFAAVSIFLLLLAWCWFLLEYARGLLEMHRHVAWSIRLQLRSKGQLQRIDQRKRELEQQVEKRVRSLQASSVEIPLSESKPAATIRQSADGIARRAGRKHDDDRSTEFLG